MHRRKNCPGSVPRKSVRAALVLAGSSLAIAALLMTFGWANETSARAAALDKATASAADWKGRLPITELSEDEAIVHALNRLGYGPRPGDLDRVKKMGLEKWIAQQLHPETLDDSAMQSRLDRYPTLTLSAQGLLNEYPPVDIAAKRAGLTPAEYQKRTQEMMKPVQGNRPPDDRSPQRVESELAMAKMLRAIYSERQLNEVLVDFWFNHFNVVASKDTVRWYIGPYERDVIRPHVLGKFRDLLGATAESPAMLFYLDNWLSADPRAFERMQHQPRNKRPNHAKPGAQQGPAPRKGQGLNENYGRELLELHTVGVDGGYTQQDVIEAARCLTGWTITGQRNDPKFVFDDRLHDPDAKKVMGKKIKAGGIKDGEKLLDMLAKHPSTAHFISMKLARHFVSDNPPPEIVARMAKTFQKSNGDIRTVMETLIYSPEFWSKQAVRAKVKTPFELVASTTRALGADVDQPQRLVGWSATIGEPLYQCLPPTGYKDTADAWVNTGALLNRLNFAMRLSSGKIPGTRVELSALVGSDVGTDAKLALDRSVQEFLAGQISPESRQILEKRLDDPQILRARLDDPVKEVDLGVVSGLVLGSPEFQRR